MFRNWTFGRKVGAGFTLAAIALVVVAATGYRSTKALIADDEHVSHTHRVRRQIDELLLQTVNAETGVRGFVISGKDEFLQPYTSASTASETAYADLRRLTADNPSQQQRLDRVRSLLDLRFVELKHVVEQRRTSAELGAAAVSSGEGKRLQDELRQVFADMDNEEGRLLEERARDAESTTSITTTIIVWGSAAAIALTILVGWLITSSLSKQIGSVARNVQSSATELQTAANQQASSAAEQATAMTEMTTTIGELLATSRQIAESSQRVAKVATETAIAARTGAGTVTRGSDAVATVRRQVDAIATHMLQLAQKSQQVGAVLDIVAELAEQTNILAINATIEAAGAGEGGRRFSVVADEIRKLADRVGASTKEIRTMIDDVRSAVNTTVMATEAGSKAVEVGAAQVNEMATSFSQIASLVGTTTEAAREIELSTKQQATAVEQVNIAINNVAQASREAEASTTQTLQTSDQLSTLSTELVAIVQSA